MALWHKWKLLRNRSEEALSIAKNNEIPTNSFENISEEQIATKVPDIVKQVKNYLKITKLEGQMKSVLIELQHIRSCTMRVNLIFKGIDEIVKEKWEDTPQVLADFIQGNLNLAYLKLTDKLVLKKTQKHLRIMIWVNLRTLKL